MHVGESAAGVYFTCEMIIKLHREGGCWPHFRPLATAYVACYLRWSPRYKADVRSVTVCGKCCDEADILGRSSRETLVTLKVLTQRILGTMLVCK